MSLEDIRRLVGTDRLWLAPGGTEKVEIGVTIVDVRVSYGRDQLRITPLSGRGQRWVDAELTWPVEDDD